MLSQDTREPGGDPAEWRELCGGSHGRLDRPATSDARRRRRLPAAAGGARPTRPVPALRRHRSVPGRQRRGGDPDRAPRRRGHHGADLLGDGPRSDGGFRRCGPRRPQGRGLRLRGGLRRRQPHGHRQGRGGARPAWRADASLQGAPSPGRGGPARRRDSHHRRHGLGGHALHHRHRRGQRREDAVHRAGLPAGGGPRGLRVDADEAQAPHGGYGHRRPHPRHRGLRLAALEPVLRRARVAGDGADRPQPAPGLDRSGRPGPGRR